jgi:hypothetical protein
MNMHHLLVDGNLCDDHGNTLKMDRIQDYNRNMGYVKNLTERQTLTPSAEGPSN